MFLTHQKSSAARRLIVPLVLRSACTHRAILLQLLPRAVAHSRCYLLKRSTLTPVMVSQVPPQWRPPCIVPDTEQMYVPVHPGGIRSQRSKVKPYRSVPCSSFFPLLLSCMPLALFKDHVLSLLCQQSMVAAWVLEDACPHFECFYCFIDTMRKKTMHGPCFSI
ncbi:galectin-1 [Platysternon megacephalum]|uniref:Galectin-1 n=1 Tax=Platysternon megacephalum TaxID=55544 RepID=A0A4D9ECK3_9SAUR|nr:galectin-1 [Platysternon megacephalum]